MPITNRSEAQSDVLQNAGDLPVKRTLATLVMAFIEAACVFAVAAAKAGVVLGSFVALLTGWSISLHRDVIRIPLLIVAMTGASFNLYLIWNRRRLRNSPAAKWRKRALSKREQFNTRLVFLLSVATLMVGAAEIYFHRVLHHTII